MTRYYRPRGLDTVEKLAEFILQECQENTETGCLEWPHHLNGSGYPSLRLNGKQVSGHRITLAAKEPGFLEDGLQAMHICDNRKCCNPEHLESGTNSENQIDCVNKGRDKHKRELTSQRFRGRTDLRGSSNGNAKLTEQQAIAIYTRAQAGENQHKIAADFNVSPVTVNHINTGRTWSHTTGATKK